MTNKNRHSRRGRPRRDRRIIVRGVKREVPDTRKLARALIALAKEQVERDVQAAAETTHDASDPPHTPALSDDSEESS